ncbi:putative tail fiber protein [Agrobacterium phage OLIVR2]|uniref:Putative tail fiber protein n=1 Tax=Agrobacterium phage OLIVR1 TaxID=2723769 RepID=A0A858MRS5_9CAUD|nr:hypothetical protein [Xanthomonas campestris]YP_010107138.1 minor tail protein [Agrobacterium phage OLIVR1]QIW87406.1 putative tail fiber protein [Agrobacterium phage OLIVR2]QIW87513.1 putative tail fiber protein [Agrobacterium phage OLIVR3]MCF8861603.1 hypothetical protein [Xanthomonas campestris pv. campestris]QIW87299.1 putative tail fiber protein [Agrobacterium phage OLIVR1]
MASRNTFQTPSGAIQPELVVDKILRTSYDVVKYVASNMDSIKTVGDNVDSLAEIIPYIPQFPEIVGAKDQAVEAAGRAETALAAVEAIQEDLLSDITANASMLPPGTAATADYDPETSILHFGIPAAPVNSLAIGTVTNGPAAATITGETPNQILNLTLPSGQSSWTPIFANVISGARIVQQVINWIGGTGDKPTIGLYVSPDGLTADIALATNIRGASGSGSGDMQSATYDPNNISANVYDRGNHTGSQSMSTITGLNTAITNINNTLADKQDASAKGQANGYASLDNNGKVPLSQINESLIGAMNFKGLWDADTNTPAIPIADAANKGWYYVVSVTGTTPIDGVSDWSVGDWIVSNGTAWDKIDSSDQVTSVNGKTGSVVLNKSDVGLANVANKSEADMVASGAIADALADKATTEQGDKADTALQPTDVGTAAAKNFYYGTSAPTDDFGTEGDIYFRYE